MAGIYIHIPFCQSRCIYCDFYSTTLLQQREDYVRALSHEIQQADTSLPIHTIYIGGGTPSQLSIAQLQHILHLIYIRYQVSPEAEVTLEANPDDLTPDYVRGLRSLPINRLSMGIQTFSDARLRFLHRRHTAQQARQAVLLAQQAGFSNLSVDLMFGFPQQTLAEWEDDLTEVLRLRVPHVSAYSLMYEDGTPLTRMLDRGDISEIDEELSRRMYATLVHRLRQTGYEHYEISNFALPGFRSRHNSSYWNDTPYLGFGPAAHSYDGRTRSWNSSDLALYLQTYATDSPQPLSLRQTETLSSTQRYNERVLTRLRTLEGISLPQLQSDFGSRVLQYFLSQAQPHLLAHRLRYSSDHRSILLTESGILVSNDVMSDLMQLS